MDETNEQHNQQSGPSSYQAGPPPMPPKEEWWSNFINFRKLLMFSLIKYLYILGALVVTVAGLRAMFSRSYSYWGIGGFWQGLAILVIGNFVWRLTCEGLIVLFRIAEGVSNIESKLR
ncbi:MAG: DUF4282 domain-containing protein [Candidatus Cryosericum sp.]